MSSPIHTNSEHGPPMDNYEAISFNARTYDQTTMQTQTVGPRRARLPHNVPMQAQLPAASYTYATQSTTSSNANPTHENYSGGATMNLPMYTAMPDEPNVAYLATFDNTDFDLLWNGQHTAAAWPDFPNNPPPPYTTGAFSQSLSHMNTYVPIPITSFLNVTEAVSDQHNSAHPAESDPGLQFVDYGSQDPQKGKRRKDENEDHRRKENIARKGGACHSCKSSRKQCDGDQPCSRCRKKGLLSESAMQAQLSDDSLLYEQHLPCFATDTKRLFDWRKQFGFITRGVEGYQTIFLDVSSGSKRRASFQVPTDNLAQCFRAATRDLVGIDLSADDFAAAFSPKSKTSKSKTLDQPKASLAAHRVLEVFLAIRNFLHSDVVASVSNPQISRSLCAFILVCMLDSLIERVCVIEHELSILSHIHEFCYRKWDENLESIALLQKIMQSLERLPAKKELEKLLSPLQDRAGSFRAHLNHLAKIARPPSKAVNLQQKSSKKQTNGHKSETTEDDGLPHLYPATLVISQHEDGAAIPVKGSCGVVEAEAPRMPVTFLLESRGSFSDYQQDVFDGKEAPLPQPSRHTLWRPDVADEAYLGLDGSDPDYDQHDDLLLLEDGNAFVELNSQKWSDTPTERNTVTTGITDVRAFEDASTIFDPENVFDLGFDDTHDAFGTPQNRHFDHPVECYSESVTPKARPEPLLIPSRKSSLSMPSPASPSKQVQFVDSIEKVAEIEYISPADLAHFNPADPEKFSLVMAGKRRTRSANSSSRSRERAPRKKMNVTLRFSNPFGPLIQEPDAL